MGTGWPGVSISNIYTLVDLPFTCKNEQANENITITPTEYMLHSEESTLNGSNDNYSEWLQNRTTANTVKYQGHTSEDQCSK